MKKLRWLGFPLIVALVILLPWVVFLLRSQRTLSVVVLDKTVPFDTYIEHSGFYWLMDQLKIVQPSGDRYDPAADYLGARPGPEPGDLPASTRDLTEEDTRGADLLYVIDTYGIYEEDLESGEDRLAALERSPKIYGGLTVDEARAVRATRDRGVPVIAEFNTMASPTPHAAVEIIEEVVGVRWTRWVGRYFPHLEDRDEVPQWLRDLCQRELNQPWKFEGSGYALIQDDTRCEILAGKDSPRIGLTVDPDFSANDPLPSTVTPGTPYTFWFDLVIPGEDTDVLAAYRWELSESGADKLRRLGLPRRFPAVTRHRDAAGTPAYYFAGDFGDSTLGGGRVPFAGFLTVRRWIEKGRRIPSHRAFFYRFYMPMMIHILEDVEARS